MGTLHICTFLACFFLSHSFKAVCMCVRSFSVFVRLTWVTRLLNSLDLESVSCQCWNVRPSPTCARNIMQLQLFFLSILCALNISTIQVTVFVISIFMGCVIIIIIIIVIIIHNTGTILIVLSYMTGPFMQEFTRWLGSSEWMLVSAQWPPCRPSCKLDLCEIPPVGC